MLAEKDEADTPNVTLVQTQVLTSQVARGKQTDISVKLNLVGRGLKSKFGGKPAIFFS